MESLKIAIMAMIAFGLLWLCCILEPVAAQWREKLPVVIEQAQAANRNVEGLKQTLKDWHLFQSDDRSRR